MNTPRLITNQAGNTVWQWNQTEPFGDNLPNQDPNGTGNQFTFNLRFTGQYSDVETGLFYNYFRDYDPVTGRYVESDPIGLGGRQFSTYPYVAENPLKYFDPLGLVRPGESSIEAAIESAIERGDVQSLNNLVQSGALSPAQEAAAQQGIRAIDILENGIESESRLAQILGKTRKEIKKAIHDCKNKLRSKGARETNPDVIVDPRNGNVYFKLQNGQLGDLIDNIYDYL